MTDALLQSILVALQQQNELLTKMIGRQEQQQEQWKKANPELSKRCAGVVQALGRMQQSLLEEVAGTTEEMDDCESPFVVHDFVDKFGTRMMHLNGLIQVFTQLGSNNASRA